MGDCGLRGVPFGGQFDLSRLALCANEELVPPLGWPHIGYSVLKQDYCNISADGTLHLGTEQERCCKITKLLLRSARFIRIRAGPTQAPSPKLNL